MLYDRTKYTRNPRYVHITCIGVCNYCKSSQYIALRDIVGQMSNVFYAIKFNGTNIYITISKLFKNKYLQFI